MWSKIQYWPRILITSVGLVIFTSLLALPIVLSSLLTSSGGPAFRMMGWWAKIIAFFMGLKFSVFGTENVIPGQSYIVTPNHQGNTDILALVIKLPLRFRWVIKKELLRIPIFGSALAGTGAIAIDRSNKEASVQSLKRAEEKLSNGWSLLIYPEGTRNIEWRTPPVQERTIHDGDSNRPSDPACHIERRLQDSTEKDNRIASRAHNSYDSKADRNQRSDRGRCAPTHGTNQKSNRFKSKN